MLLLPPILRPFRRRIRRRHTPKVSNDYSNYRDCLRWEFGFICGFCLLHESDFIEFGAEGTGVTWIEHIERQARRADLKCDYDNCVYSCRFCNRSRGVQEFLCPSTGARILTPTENKWSSRFRLYRDRLEPRPGDRDAARTCDVYDLNAPRKVDARRARRTHLREALRVIENADLINALLDQAKELGPSHPRSFKLITAAKRLRICVQRARRDLSRYIAVPTDAPNRCRCRRTDALSLPRVVSSQLIELRL